MKPMRCPYCGVDDGPVERACRCPEPKSYDYQLANVGAVRSDGKTVEQLRQQGWLEAGKDPRYSGVWMRREVR